MRTDYHTVVIGAGPAGLNAARFLEKSALVIDKKPEIGLPIRCGEGVSLYALQREGIEPTDDIVRTRTHQIRRIMPSGKFLGEYKIDPYAFVIDRRKFEVLLSEKVPGHLRMATSVRHVRRVSGLWEVETSEGIVKAKHLIGADGPNSLIARQVFQRPVTVIAAVSRHYILSKPIAPDVLQMCFHPIDSPAGYGWIFPTSYRSANIGLLSKQNKNTRALFEKFLDTHVRPAYGDVKVTVSRSGLLPARGHFSSVEKDNCYLTGDAGAFTDPIFEGGINLALYTGRLAAESINSGEPGSYQKKISQLPFTGFSLLTAQRLFYNMDAETLNYIAEKAEGGSSHALMAALQSTPTGDRMNLTAAKLQSMLWFFSIWNRSKMFLW